MGGGGGRGERGKGGGVDPVPGAGLAGPERRGGPHPGGPAHRRRVVEVGGRVGVVVVVLGGRGGGIRSSP